MFHYRIQRHDYSSQELENVPLAQIVNAFTGCDWPAERRLFRISILSPYFLLFPVPLFPYPASSMLREGAKNEAPVTAAEYCIR